MPSSAYPLLAGAFAGGSAPFALHPSDRETAADYLKEALVRGVDWVGTETDIRAYGQTQDWTPAVVRNQLARARPLLLPWLL